MNKNNKTKLKRVKIGDGRVIYARVYKNTEKEIKVLSKVYKMTKNAFVNWLLEIGLKKIKKDLKRKRSITI